jgi:hypothetical protein
VHCGALYCTGTKKDVESLAALEHDGITYSEFNKDFYDESPEIFAMSQAEVSGGAGRQGIMRQAGRQAGGSTMYHYCGDEGH